MNWLTYENVAKLDPCPDQLELFKKWLNGRKKVAITAKNVQSALDCGLDVCWLIRENLDIMAMFGGDNGMRQMFCRKPEWAYCYACDVDQGPHDATREAACQNPKWAYRYAYYVDQGPHDGSTREAACKDPYWANWYARDVDKGPCDATRDAACKSPEWADAYTAWERKIS